MRGSSADISGRERKVAAITRTYDRLPLALREKTCRLGQVDYVTLGEARKKRNEPTGQILGEKTREKITRRRDGNCRSLRW